VTNTTDFQLTQLTANEFPANPVWSNGYELRNVRVVGYNAGGSVVATSTAIDTDTQGTQTTFTFGSTELANFAGVNIRKFRLLYRNQNNTWSTGMRLLSFDAIQDTTPPTVSSINRVTSAQTNAASVDYTVTFSEDVTGVGTSDFTLTSTGTASGMIASVTPVSAS